VLGLGACSAQGGGAADDGGVVYQAPIATVAQHPTATLTPAAPAQSEPAQPDPAPAAPAAPPQNLGSTEGDPVGVWIAPDGATAFILENGVCSGMYYNGSVPLDIGGGMTCAYAGNTLVVSQPPNQISYKVYYSGDTMTIVNGTIAIAFTRG
jgi:hypothetical protein